MAPKGLTGRRRPPARQGLTPSARHIHLIRRGLQDAVIAGGAESAITPLGVGGFSAMKALSTRNAEPERASRPFDKESRRLHHRRRSGVLILEERERALGRGAKIYAEVIGYGCNGDAYHMTAPAPHGEGAGRCMKLALKDAADRSD